MNGFVSLLDLIRQRAAEFPNQIAYQFVTSHGTYDSLTYAQLDHRATAVAAVLRQSSCQGERAVVLLPPGLDYLVAFFGCLYAGVIAVPVYPPSRNRHSQRLFNIIDDAKVNFFITHQVFANQYPAAPAGIKIICVDLIPTQAEQAIPSLTPGPDEIAFLQYTSGSTNSPKGVMVSFGNIAANLEVLKNNFGEQCHVTCSWLPPYHDMGLVAGIILPLYLKSRTILMSPSYFLQSPVRWLEIISKEKVVLSGAPNFAYDLCVKKIQAEQLRNLDLSCWKYAVNGAEVVRQATIQHFIDTFAVAGFAPERIYPCYGLAEATLMLTGKKAAAITHSLPLLKTELERGQVVIATEENAENVVNFVSCGVAQKDHDICIVDPHTHKPLPERSWGEIWACGPSIAKGYFNKPEMTETIFHAELTEPVAGKESNSYMRTGDLGFIYQNELYVGGRIKDLIIIKGLNYYPEDIELTATASHPAFVPHGAAAFSVVVENEEHLVVLQEVARDQLHKIDVAAALRAIEVALLNEYGLQAYSIVLIKPHSLAKTSSGKIQRWVCRSEFLTNSLRVLATSHAANEVNHSNCETYEATRAWLVAWFAQQLRVSESEISGRDLHELEFSSLTAAELASELSNRFGKRFEITSLLEQPSLEDLSRFITNHGVAKNVQQKSSVEIAEKSLVKPLDPDLLSAVKDIYFKVNAGISANNTIIDGSQYINFSGYNYLGMSGDAQVTAAVVAAIQEFGTSVSASRLVSGEKPLHHQLENAISKLIGTDETAVLSSGYATNLAVITHLFGPGDLVIYDALAHNSILQGAQFSGATCMAFPHNDIGALEAILEKKRDQYRRVLIVSEGVFSMDGDICEATALIAIKKRFQCFLMLDEAHSMGVIGNTGCGIREYYNLNPKDVDIWMGTLSKSFASCGGYISGSSELIENFKYSSAGFVYSAGISPANTAAAFAAVELMRQQPERINNLQQRHSLLLSLLRKASIPTGKSSDTPIIPLMAGSTEGAIKLSSYLKTCYINALPIFYPAVEKTLARVRLFVNCLHTEEQVHYTADAIIAGYQTL